MHQSVSRSRVNIFSCKKYCNAIGSTARYTTITLQMLSAVDSNIQLLSAVDSNIKLLSAVDSNIKLSYIQNASVIKG